jgi:hypothetical protein
MNQEDRSQRRRRGALAGLSAAAGAAVAAAIIPATPAFASPADDAAAAAAAAPDLMKVTDLTRMDDAITTYFDDLSPAQRLAEFVGTAGGGSDAGALAVAQENATVVDIFGNTSSPGAESFENSITGYYTTLTDLLGGGGGGITADAAAATKVNEDVVMERAIETYFSDLSGPTKVAEAELMGFQGNSPDPGDLAVAQENATITDIFGSLTSPGATSFEEAITSYYDTLTSLLPGQGGGGITTFADAASVVSGGGSTGEGLLDTDLQELGLSTAFVTDVNDVLAVLPTHLATEVETIGANIITDILAGGAAGL